MARQRRRQELAQEEVEDQDGDAGDHDRPGGRPPDTLGAAFGLQPLPAADDGDDDAEDGRLDQAGHHVPELEVLEGVPDIDDPVHAHDDDVVKIAGGDADDVAVEGQAGQHKKAARPSGHDEITDGVGAQA